MPDPAEQFANPYLAMGNNPAMAKPETVWLMYVDPDGEYAFFIIPHISFGNGSFDIGLTGGFGVPGVASVQATVGHTFYEESDDNTYATVGGSLGGFTASVGYGTQTGYTAGAGFGFGPVGVNSNVFSAGVSWSQNYGVNVSAFGASYGNGGFGFSPTMGYAHFFSSEERPVYGYVNGMACDDCPPAMVVNLPEVGVVGYRTESISGASGFNPSTVKHDDRYGRRPYIELEKPWFPGPYEGSGANWANAKALGASLDSFLYGPKGFKNLTEIATILGGNIIDVVLWQRMALPPYTPGFDQFSPKRTSPQIASY